MSPSADCPSPSGSPPALRRLFVYGTLRRAYLLLPQPLRRMRPPHVLDTHGKWVGTGVLRGHELWDVGKYPGVLKSEREDGRVVGDVFEVEDEKDAWTTLDRYEGIGEEFERPQEYCRHVAEVEVVGEDGEEKNILTAWVYLYNWPIDKQSMSLVLDGDYVKHTAMSM